MNDTQVSEGSAEFEGFEISSTGASSEQILESLESLKPPSDDEPIDPSKAAAALGKKGGEATAAKRKAEAEAADDLDTADPETPEAAAKPGEEIPPPKRSARARVLEATRAAKEAREEAERARADAAQARSERAEYARQLEAARNPQKAPPPKPVDPNEPKAGDYEDWNVFQADLIDYNVKKALSERGRQEQAHYAEREREARIDSLVSEAGKAHAEFIESRPTFLDEVSEEILDFRPSLALSRDESLGPDNVIADEIILSKAAGPLLQLHLTDHPEELQRLRALRTPQELQVEIRLLAKTLTAATTGSTVKGAVSKAKPPLKPVSASPRIAEDDLSSEMSLDEYVPRANARERARR